MHDKPTVLSFNAITWDTDDGTRILNEVSGTIVGGTVTAIMGASGSGKTTLLQILACQRQQTHGNVLLNGMRLEADSKRYIGMVPQDDTLLATSTVKEAIEFSAAIRLPPRYSAAERAQIVTQLIADLGLEKVRNSRIGDSRRRNGISGGEQKRCSIAIELAHRPQVLLLDEPTSGLDSSAAHQLMKLLQTLAHTSGVAVACTIHQPSSRDFSLFDKLLVLSCGRTVYYGETEAALEHFTTLGHPCPTYTNPAEHILDLSTGMEIGEDRRGRLVNKFSTTDAGDRLSAEMQEINTLVLAAIASGSSNDRDEKAKRADLYASGFVQQFRLLFARSWRHARRNPASSRAAMSRSITMGLLVGFLYYDVDNSQVSVQDRTGALYFVLTTQIFSAQASLRVFLEERDLFFRENLAGAYRTSAYYWAKSLADTPLQLLNAVLFSLLGYYLVGLQSSATHMLTYCIAVIITTVAAESYVVFVGAAAPDDKVAAVLGPVAFALMSLLGGFFLNLESLPFWFGWMQYLSLFRYSFAAVMQNEFLGLTFTCSQDDTAKWVETLDESTREHVMEFIHLLPCPTPDGETHLKRLKINTMPVWANIFYLVLLMVLFRVMGYYSLKWRANKLAPTGAGPQVTKAKKQAQQEHQRSMRSLRSQKLQ